MTKSKSPNKGLPTYLPEYQHKYLDMECHKLGIKKTEYIRRLLDEKIKEEFPVFEHERRRELLTKELEVVELLINESEQMENHAQWVKKELERIVPNLAKGNEPTAELAKYVSSKLGLAWPDFWCVVEQYRETGKVEV
ncbi:hypothetical protein [uncultured Methanobacterium sp.]|uniref:hypothetical protein n=1 Tax=uncultured Methanobacterium sp. TaxID=176306 RepID=UPI002AA6A586|nr:hypothetical protein [uncultured Methanobacterium sp.]